MVGKHTTGRRFAQTQHRLPRDEFEHGQPSRTLKAVKGVGVIKQFETINAEPGGFQREGERFRRVRVDVTNLQRRL